MQTMEVTVSRSPTGQLGFHVSRDAIITDVERHSAADAAGLKPLSRLVKICGSDVITMSHDQMIELLRSSTSAILTVVPYHGDVKTRR